MDVQRIPRDSVFSILNDNDCPSFTIKKSPLSPQSQPQKLPSISSFTSFCPPLERPNLARNPQFTRTASISSAGTPPLLRYDSSSSTKSSRSMDSTPSPITPAYSYNDNNIVPYESLLRQEPAMNYLPSPSTTGITPFLEQGMMIGNIDAVPQGDFATKVSQQLAPRLPPQLQPQLQSQFTPQLAPAGYPLIPTPADLVQMPTPALSTDTTVSSMSSANAPANTSPAAATGAPPTGKKNKYPCPYAQSHSCSATFTTSGHAARHGKKHTGEKGVHCPVCDKAFTRKDNMKQHERTHKHRPAIGDEKKSKAQATRDANNPKDSARQDPAPQNSQSIPPHPAQLRKSSTGQSEPSDMTLAPNPIDTPNDISPAFFPDTNPQILLPSDSALDVDPLNASMYPPLLDEALLPNNPMSITNDKFQVPLLQPPVLVRGFSDLDTLAQAAESAFDPYFQQPQF